jgi:beta-phosphoglucomutase
MHLSGIKAVIFDLDGVIVSTDNCHYEAWKKMADSRGIYFDRTINERLRGVSRMESLEILLERASVSYTQEEKITMAAEKNVTYKELVMKLTPADILPGAMKTLEGLRDKGILIAIGSSSRNTPIILKQIGLEDYFDAVADGNNIKNSKPDPEVFLLAARMLNIPPSQCLVVEDADAGVEAALNGGMKALGVGFASANDKATVTAGSLKEIDLVSLIV